MVREALLSPFPGPAPGLLPLWHWSISSETSFWRIRPLRFPVLEPPCPTFPGQFFRVSAQLWRSLVYAALSAVLVLSASIHRIPCVVLQVAIFPVQGPRSAVAILLRNVRHRRPHFRENLVPLPARSAARQDVQQS